MMFNRILLALDRTAAAWRALPAAEDLAERLGSPLELVNVTDHPWTIQEARAALEQQWGRHRSSTAPPTITVLVKEGSTAHTLGVHTVGEPGTLLVMGSHGHGLSKVGLGSVTLDVLAASHGPVVAVGHHTVDTHRDELVIPVDGSPYSEAAITLGATMASALGARAWVVTNVEQSARVEGDVLESASPRHLADRVSALTGQEAEFEVLHGANSGTAVADFARSLGARMIVCSTHGRTGLAWLALGSVGAEIVRRAPCPVTLVRPPELAAAHSKGITATPVPQP